MKKTREILKKWLAPLDKDIPPIYLVGGIVRDYLLSRPGKDIDLMCQDAEKFARKLAKTRDAAVVPFEKKADEPCYRIVDRQDQDIFLDIAEMRGETVFADMERRDFTINAMAIQIEPGGELGSVIDPLNGRSALADKIIRVAGSRSIASDPLRILRGFRFAAELGFIIEDKTLNVMQENAQILANVAFERITVELLKIFNTDNPSFFVRQMDHIGIMSIIFPEILSMKTCTQNSFHHLDVWNHSLAVLENCEYILNNPEEFFGIYSQKIRENLMINQRSALLKLTAMLHDVGKPATRGVNEETGRITFYGHDKEGKEIIADIACRLRISLQAQKFIQTLIEEHLHILNLSKPGIKSVTKMKLFRKLKDDIIPLIILGISDIKGTLGPDSDEAGRRRHIEWSEKMISNYYEDIKKRIERPNLITGKDLIDMGIKPGPEMGQILRKIREAQDNGIIKDRDEALALLKNEKP